MKRICRAALLATVLCLPANRIIAADADPKADLKDLVSKIQTKLREGKRAEADHAEELKAFDALLAKYKGQKTDDVAQIALMKALLYVQVFDNADKGKTLIRRLKQDFPETKQAKGADDLVASLDKKAEAEKLRSSLVKGSKFPDFEAKDLAGQPISLAKFKGKVVLLDFWATWCGPCIGELPNVKQAYEKHHARGFEIVGISLDSQENKLTSFLKQENMTWPQIFDGKGWQSALAQKYGINSIPATYLLDGEGTIIASNLRGPALEQAVAAALAGK
jgi:peroxiredoxin